MAETRVFTDPELTSPSSAKVRRAPDVADLEERINQQYDTDASMTFYTYIMGGGGDDMHFGIFNTGQEDLKQASLNTVHFMCNLARNVSALATSTGESVNVLDVGSGKGGSARFLAKAFGCHVTCLNLGENQNSYNRTKAAEAGLENLIAVKCGSFNDEFPEEWSSSFDLVWVQESLCHAADKDFTLRQMYRVLKPGGALVLSDIMKGDVKSDLNSTFTQQNVSKELATPNFYREALPRVGMKVISYHDLTTHLTAYFRLMQNVVTESQQELLDAGVDASRIEQYVTSIEQRFSKVESKEFAWGVFVARKEEDFNSIKAAVAALERRIEEQYDTDISMTFYKYIMGGGGDSMHYGIFKTGKEDLVTASHNTIAYMSTLAADYTALRTSTGSKMRVLDLGSGKGGSARFLAKTFGCHVTCMNLGTNQNNYNEEKAREEGLSHLITVVKGSFNETFPSDWTSEFDLVWSQEALCHAVNRVLVMSEVERVLKPGGTLLFSDVMKGEEYQDIRASSVSGGAVTARLASSDDYTQAIQASGLHLSVYRDLTANLATYFSTTARTVKQHKVALLNAGVPGYRLDAYLEDLDARLDGVQQRAFSWGAFVAKKPSIGKSMSSALLLSGLSPADTWVSVSSMLSDKPPELELEAADSPRAFLRKYITQEPANDLHMGIFNSEEDDIFTGSHNMVQLMTTIATRVSPLMASAQSSERAQQRVKVLVLEAGAGTLARALAKTYGCLVTCLELSDAMNEINKKESMESGISHLISVVKGQCSKKLPAAWTSSFDLVVGQEVFPDDTFVGEAFTEIQRVLKAGGAAILSNELQAGIPLFAGTLKPSLVQLRAAVDGAGLSMTKHLDLTPHMMLYIDILSKNVASIKENLEAQGDSLDEVEYFLEEVNTWRQETVENRRTWGVAVAYKPHYNKCLLIGAGPLGGFAAWRLAACGISDITAKVLPSTPDGIKDMLATAGCRLVTDWDEIEGSSFNIVMVATKTHWLARIAHEMTSYSVKWDNLALIYNGYVKIPDVFNGETTSSVVVPQSFSFFQETPAKGVELTSVANGNTVNPWTFPPRPSSRVVVGQLKQCGVNATVSTTYEDDQFFKFCVNNSANLLAVVSGRNCRDLTGKRDTRKVMEMILNEQFDVLQGDSKFAGLVPLERDEYIERAINAVAAYAHHKPSSLQHYEQKRLADVAGLNGFVSSMSRITHVPAPVNEYLGRSADALCRAHRRGILREAWNRMTELAAAMRLAEHMGMASGIWGNATIRHADEHDKMMVAPFGTLFREAHASIFQPICIDKTKVTEDERNDFGAGALELHTTIYSCRPDVQCVIQTSSPHAVAVTKSAGEGCSVLQAPSSFIGKTVRFSASGHGGDLSDSAVKEFAEQVTLSEEGSMPNVVFMDQGVIVMGSDVATAFSRLCHLERCCEVQLLVKSAGAGNTSSAGMAKDSVAEGMAHAEFESHKRSLLKMSGEYARPAYYE